MRYDPRETTRKVISAKFLLSTPPAKRDVIEVPATVVIKRFPTGRAAGLRRNGPAGGAIGGGLSSQAMGVMYHGGKR